MLRKLKFRQKNCFLIKKRVSKNCAPFPKCISETNNIQVDNAKDIDVVMPMYNSKEYSNNCSRTSRSLWQYLRDEPAVNCNDAIIDFNEANPAKSFNCKAKITDQTRKNGRKDVDIMVTIKYLSNFWRILEMP